MKNTPMKLPLDCNANYVQDFLTEKEANTLYTSLMDTYKIDQARLVIKAGGETIETDSFKLLFASEELILQNSHPKEIHGASHVFTGAMRALKEKVEQQLQKEFPLAMCLYYPNGNYFAPHHSDQETSGADTILPSISLGEVREFHFMHKENHEEYGLDLAHGSMLVMGVHCQERYTHSLPQNMNYKKGRINITFREANFK